MKLELLKKDKERLKEDHQRLADTTSQLRQDLAKAEKARDIFREELLENKKSKLEELTCSFERGKGKGPECRTKTHCFERAVRLNSGDRSTRYLIYYFLGLIFFDMSYLGFIL